MIKNVCTVVLVSVSALSARAADVSIGPFCLSGVNEKTNPADMSLSDGVQWIRASHTYQAPDTGPSKASLVVFSRPVPHDPGSPPDCLQLRATASAKGIPAILEGQIESLNMKSRLGIGSPGNRLWIDPDGSLSLVMKKVNSGLQAVGGGTLQLAGSLLWMRNVGTFLSSPEKINGVFEIEAYNRKIVDAKLTLPGGSIGAATFTQREPDKENLFLRVDMASGVAKLWKGDLVASKVNVSGPSLLLPKLELSNVSFTADAAGLKISNGVVTGAFSKIKGTASALTTDEDRLVLDASAVIIKQGDLAGDVAQATSGFEWSSLAASNFGATSDNVTMTAAKSVIAKGPASAMFAQIAKSNVKGAIEWAKPAMANLPVTIPDGRARSLLVSVAGPPDATKISGDLNVGAFSLSGLNVVRDLALSFAPTSGSTTVAIPIDLKTPGFGGDIELSDYDQKVFLRADLASFRLKGTIFLDLADIVDGSRLDIQPDGLSAGLSSAVSLMPWLAGTKPGLAKVGVTIGNSELVTLRKTKPTGNLDLTTDLLVLAEPVLRIGEGATQKRASLQLDAIGKASFAYGVEDRKLVTQKAKFEAKNVDFHMLEPGGSTDIGGTIVTEPHLTMERLFIDLDRKADVRVTEANTVVVRGATFSRSRKEKTETAFGGKQKLPFQIKRIVAEPEFNDTSITVRSIDAENLSFGIDDAFLTLGDSLVLRDAAITLTADRIRSVDEIQKKEDGTDEKDDQGNVVRKRREYFGNLAVSASGKLKESEFSNTMQLDAPPTVKDLSIRASGRSDMLDGSGSFHISPFSGRYQSVLEFGFACKDGTHPRTPTETRFTTGGTPGGALAIKIDKGAFGVEGVLAGLNLLYKGDTSVECDSPSETKVLSPRQEWWTWGICPTWSEPTRKCKWSTVIPEISFGYHLRFGFYGLAGQATVAAPVLSVKNGQTKFCWLPPVVFAPMAVAMGITPQMEFNGSHPGDAEKVLNGIIHASLSLVESQTLTFIGNTAALAVGGFISTPENAILGCALVRN